MTRVAVVGAGSWGTALASLLAGGARLPLPRCVGLIGQLAGALDYAHDANVVHEDLTPARIIVKAGDHPTIHELIDYEEFCSLRH